ncbi:MAG: type IV secretion system DNA-binding domain-containing protein [Candidatus Pacebacteria bacterium]|nr:type IV secretion system DNA-binding domain-containing protein [Candidatus Paceibacterota bacterium]
MSNEIPQNRDTTYFAETNYRGKKTVFGIKRKDRRQHMYVVGKSGTGKSAMLKNMIVQNIKNGEGLAIVDPHGELAEEVLELIPEERKGDVVYFNPADTEHHIGFNIIEVPDPKYKHLIASGLMGVFTKIWANVWSARMEYIMNNAILALIDTPGSTMLGIPRLLVDQNYRQQIIANVKDPVVKAFWTNEYESWQERFRNEAIAPIQNKVGQFLSTSIVRNIVGQSKSTINIFDIMNNKKILIVNVSKGRVGEDNSALLGAMLITKIQLAAMERVRIPEDERKDFYLYIDEFQNFVTESFASILSEARKYRLCLCIAHQYIAQLTTPDSTSVRDAVFGNVGTMIVFRIGATDAEYIEQEFVPELEAADFVNLPNYQMYTRLMVDGITSRPFSANTLPPFKVEGSKSIAEEIITASRKNYGRDREVVEKEISDWASGKTSDESDTQNDNIAKKAEDATPDEQGNYKVRCSFNDCKNIATVPFKPMKGRPVYCKEHVDKIKSGEVEAIKVKPYTNKAAQASMSALASMGIAFDPQKTAPAQSSKRPDYGKKPERRAEPRRAPSETRRVHMDEKPVRSSKPDTGGLKDILGSIFGNKKASPEKTPTVKIEPIPVKDIPKPISLSALSDKKEKTPEPTLSSVNTSSERGAKPTSQNALAEALAQARAEEKANDLAVLGAQTLLRKDEPEATADDTQRLLEEARQASEKRAEEARREIEEERKKREQIEREKEEHAKKLLEEERKRKAFEQEAAEIKKRLADIEAEKERIRQQILERDANTAQLLKEKAELEHERTELSQSKQASDKRTGELEQEKRHIEEMKRQAEERAQKLQQEKAEREKRDHEEKSRKEVPEDILKSVLD